MKECVQCKKLTILKNNSDKCVKCDASYQTSYLHSWKIYGSIIVVVLFLIHGFSREVNTPAISQNTPEMPKNKNGNLLKSIEIPSEKDKYHYPRNIASCTDRYPVHVINRLYDKDYITYASFDSEQFFLFCAKNNTPVASVCPSYIECISTVKYNNDSVIGEGFKLLSFVDTAKYIKSEFSSDYSNIDLRIPKNEVANELCQKQSSANSVENFASFIYASISNISYEDALKLSNNSGYDFGNCLCSIDNYLKAKTKFSIGTCKGNVMRYR